VRARSDTNMSIAAERLAVIAAITLTITLLLPIMGVNVIRQRFHKVHIANYLVNKAGCD
jgi:hypothetical protein